MIYTRNSDTPSQTQKQGARSYHSPVRKKQAEITRQRILNVASKLLHSVGYAKMTIAGIAREAGVSPPTVYAAFKSKRGILAELLDRDLMTPTFHKLIKTVEQSNDPQEKLRVVVQLVRIANELELPREFQLAGDVENPVDTELWRALLEREYQRRAHLLLFCQHLREYGVVRNDLSDERATDILWAFTGRPIFYMLVHVCRWDAATYEEWLYNILRSELFANTD